MVPYKIQSFNSNAQLDVHILQKLDGFIILFKYCLNII